MSSAEADARMLRETAHLPQLNLAQVLTTSAKSKLGKDVQPDSQATWVECAYPLREAIRAAQASQVRDQKQALRPQYDADS